MQPRRGVQQQAPGKSAQQGAAHTVYGLFERGPKVGLYHDHHTEGQPVTMIYMEPLVQEQRHCSSHRRAYGIAGGEGVEAEQHPQAVEKIFRLQQEQRLDEGVGMVHPFVLAHSIQPQYRVLQEPHGAVGELQDAVDGRNLLGIVWQRVLAYQCCELR